jgi:hypothetical protein
MNYKFDIDKWYIINETTAGKLDAGLELGTIHEPEWFDNEEDWVVRCEKLNIDEEQ